MLTLAFTLIPSPDGDAQRTLLEEAGQGSLGQLIRWVRQQARYRRALHELQKLDDRDLDDIGIARGAFPELAWRHVTGAEPLAGSQRH
jgi:uncharacterized protein YjiS (DUF1127 family)